MHHDATYTPTYTLISRSGMLLNLAIVERCAHAASVSIFRITYYTVFNVASCTTTWREVKGV